MEQFIERLKANLKFLIIAAIALSTLHAGIGFCRHIPPVDVLLGFGFSVLVFFPVWGIYNLNYIIQKHNSMIKIETVKKNNRFGIWIGLIAGIIAVIVDLVVPFFLPSEDFYPIAMSSFVLGELFAALKIDDKDKDKYEQINATKDIRPKEFTGVFLALFGAVFFICGIGLLCSALTSSSKTESDSATIALTSGLQTTANPALPTDLILPLVFGAIGIAAIVAGIIIYKKRER